MFFKNPKQRYKKLLIIIIPLFIALVVCGFFAYYNVSSSLGQTISGPGKKDSFNNNSMDYHLRSNATDYQKELFNELNELIKDGIDESAIAASVVKNFIADAYTWNNKKGQWDVGGMCYVYSPMKSNFYFRLRDDFYGQLNQYIDKYGSDSLLEVESIEIQKCEKCNGYFEVDGKQYEYYYVRCQWKYKENSRFANEIKNLMNFTVIKNGEGRFEIVENYGD